MTVIDGRMRIDHEKEIESLEKWSWWCHVVDKEKNSPIKLLRRHTAK